MFEFTKSESDRITATRKTFNEGVIKDKTQKEAKKMFGKLFTKVKPGDSGRGGSVKTENSNQSASGPSGRGGSKIAK